MWIPRASRRASGRERGPAPRGSPSTSPRRDVNSGLPWSEQDDSDPLWMINNRRGVSARALFLCRPPRRLSEPAPRANTRSGSVPRGAAAGSGHSSLSPTRPESISSRSCAAVLPVDSASDRLQPGVAWLLPTLVLVISVLLIGWITGSFRSSAAAFSFRADSQVMPELGVRAPPARYVKALG